MVTNIQRCPKWPPSKATSTGCKLTGMGCVTTLLDEAEPPCGGDGGVRGCALGCRMSKGVVTGVAGGAGGGAGSLRCCMSKGVVTGAAGGAGGGAGGGWRTS
jgi:hypothetical protein